MKNMDDDMLAIPCGKIARSFFTDTFILMKNNTEEKLDNKSITINETGIAWH
jgi:hypothetical protein